jgi:hypothetical protein
MPDDDDFQALLRETSGKVDRLYNWMQSQFEQSPPLSQPSPTPSPSVLPDDEPSREELMERLAQKNRQIQLLKIRIDYLENKLEKYEPTTDDEAGQEYDD